MVNTEEVKEYLKNASSAESGILSVIQAGAVSGSVGLFAGGIVGTIRSPRPAIFATALGAESFLLGSFFWFTRATLCKAWLIEPSSPPEDRIKASAAAGGITGGVGGALLRPRSAIIPATLIFTLLGYAGQKSYNYLDARHTSEKQLAHAEDRLPRKSFWQRVANSKYSPMKVLSDEDYEKVLKEKLVRVEAEIALIDDDIVKLKSQATQDQDSS